MDEDALEIEIALTGMDFAPTTTADARDKEVRTRVGAGAADSAVAGTAELCGARPAPVELPKPFAEVVAWIASARVRELVANIYARQLRALEALAPIEKVLATSGEMRVAPLFDELRSRCASLLSYITAEVVAADFLDEEVRAALDGTRFVIAHEMGKVFRSDFFRSEGVAARLARTNVAGLARTNGDCVTRADVARAWGLMQNCLQQTAITLAQLFDPSACGERLFDNYQHKVEDSLALFHELKLLLRKVRRAEESTGILLKHSLVMHLELFRGETMHLLMYKDWAEFEGFVDDVRRAFEEMEGFDITLHKFASYLETLIHHVGMREVLRNKIEASPASERRPATSTPDLARLNAGRG
jgi:hypothetical protein